MKNETLIRSRQVGYKKQSLNLLLLLLFVQLLPCRIFSAYADNGRIRDICEYLGGRADKNFLGSGNLALVIEPGRTRILFVQQWKEKGLFDWAAGTVHSWCPDRIVMNEAMPPVGAAISLPPISRTVFICLLYTSDAADDLLCVDLGGRRIIKK